MSLKEKFCVFLVICLITAGPVWFAPVSASEVGGLDSQESGRTGMQPGTMAALPNEGGALEHPWPMSRYDPQGTGQSPLLGPDGEVGYRQWIFHEDLVDHTDFYADAPPVQAVDGTIYSVAGSSLFAVDPEIGGPPEGPKWERWSHHLDSEAATGLALGSDGTIYAVDIELNLYAIHDEGGQGVRKWVLPLSMIGTVNSSPIIAPDGTILISTSAGYLGSVSPMGSVNWIADLSTMVLDPLIPSLGWTGAALGIDGTIYIGYWGQKVEDPVSYLLAVLPANGELKYSALLLSQIGKVEAAPAVGLDGTVYLGTTYFEERVETPTQWWSYLYAIAPSTSTASEKWRFRMNGKMQAAPSIPSSSEVGSEVYVGSDNVLYALTSGGALLWRFDAYSSGDDKSLIHSCAIASNGTIYLTCDDLGSPGDTGFLYSLSPYGTMNWSFPLTIDGNNSPPIIGLNQRLYLMSTFAPGPPAEYQPGTDLIAFWPTPTIKVGSPAGGEGWELNTVKPIIQPITWTTSRLLGNVKIELNRSYPQGPWTTIWTSIANDGVEEWAVTGPNSNNCRMRISSTVSPEIQAISLEDFVIGIDGVHLIAPKGDEYWTVGSAETIRWVSINSSSPVKIELERTPTQSSVLSSLQPASGKLLWQVTGDESDQCRIIVTSIPSLVYKDSSNGYFTIALSSPSPWPSFQQNSQRTGSTTTAIGPDGGYLAWKFDASTFISVETGGGKLYGAPVIGNDGSIFLSATKYLPSSDRYQDILLSITPNGITKWQRPYQTNNYSIPSTSIEGITSPPLYLPAQGMVVFASQYSQTGNFRGSIRFVSEAIGEDIKNPYETEGVVYGSPLFDPEAAPDSACLFFADDLGFIYGLTDSGDPKWKEKWKLQTNGNLIWPSLALNPTNKLLYVADDNGWLYALGSGNGQVQWSFRTAGPIRSSPALDKEGNVYFGSDDGYLYSVAANGSLRWKYYDGMAIRSSPTISPSGVVYLSSGRGRVLALTLGGAEKWRFIANSPVNSSPAVDKDGVIFVKDDGGILYSLSPTGTLKWNQQLEIQEDFPRDRLYTSPIVGRNGMIHILNGHSVFSFWPAPTIEILTPADYEQWQEDTTVEITWRSDHLTGRNVKVEINRSYSVFPDAWETIWETVANDGVEPWKVTGPSTTDAALRISSVDYPATVFSLRRIGINPPPVLIVNQPKGGETWSVGETLPIRWTASWLPGQVHVDISYDKGNNWTRVSTCSAGQEYYNWLISGPAAKDSCKIRLTSESWPDISATSAEFFSIGLSIKILEPQGGVKLPIGSIQVISWNANGIGDSKVQITLDRNYPNGDLTTIATGCPTKGSIIWTVSGPPSDRCRFIIVSEDDPTFTGTSNKDIKIFDPLQHPWPEFHQDSFNTGSSLAIGPSTPSLAWRFSTAGYPGSPVVGSDGTVYFGSGEGIVRALTPTTGSPRWTFTATGSYIFGAPALGRDGSVYFGSSDHFFYALTPSGGLDWSFDTGAAIDRSSPALSADGSIYFGNSAGKVFALRSNGDVIWQFETSGAIQSSPAVAPDGTIYVGSSTKLYALTPTSNPNGEMKWQFMTGGMVLSSPVYSTSANCVYFGSSDGRFYAVQAETGAQLWRFPIATATPIGAIRSSPAIGPNGSITFGSDDGYVYTLSPSGRLLWRYLTDGAIESSPAIDGNGSIYVGSNGKIAAHFYALSSTGALTWSCTTGNAKTYLYGAIKTSPAIAADGTIYFGSNDRFLYAFRPTAGIQTTSPIGGEVWPTGSNQTISWSSSGVSGNVKVELTRNYTESPTWETLYSSTANSGSVIWNVTGPATGTTCRVRVSSVDTSSIFGISPANFIIVPSVLTLAPLESTALVGQPLQVEALLADLSQQPIAGAEVTFTVAGAHSQTATTLTNPSGVASWSYAGLDQGIDQIIASAGGQATSPANVTWVNPQSIGIVGLTATPLVDVSGWKPLNLSASSPGAGSWSVRILSPGGDDVTSAGSLSITSSNPGTSFAANWVPSSYYALTGTHQAVVQLEDGTSTVTAAVTFAVHNFAVRIRSVTFTDAGFNPIAAPRAGQNFFIKVEIQNIGPSVLSMVFIPVMVSSQYIGGGAMGNVFPGQVASPFIAANIAAAGSYTLRAYSWTGPGGAALAQPLILSITVSP